MHEAGLARGVARALRQRGLRLADVRLSVRGGHHDPAAFDAELREHLADALPEDASNIGSLEIRRVAFGHLCLGCGREFEAAEIEAACPSCGASSLPSITDEEIEIERLEVPT